MVDVKQSDGFTLLELLVAMAIFSLMSIMIFSSLTSMTETREILQKKTERFAKIQSFFRVICRDITQISARPVRDGFGDELPAVSRNHAESDFEFTRNGWRNPTGRARSSLQRVRYRLQEGMLIRDNWQVLDRDIDSVPFARVLLDKVWEMDITFIGQQDKIYTQWPPEENDLPGNNEIMPRAVHVQVEVEPWGRFDRLFLINNGA